MLKGKTEFEKLFVILVIKIIITVTRIYENNALYTAHDFFTRKRLRLIKPNLSVKQLKCLKTLRKNKNEIIFRLNNCVRVVILNTIEYANKMYDIFK